MSILIIFIVLLSITLFGNFDFGILGVVGFVAMLFILPRLGGEDIKNQKKIVSADTAPKAVQKKKTKQAIPITKPIPFPKTQFEKDVRIRVERSLLKTYQGQVFWENAENPIKFRRDFIQKAKIGNNIVDMKIVMNERGPEKLEFPNSKYEDILISKTKQKDKPIEMPKMVTSKKTNAEKAGNTIINSDGKPEVKPNYKMIASEWVNENLDYLNKACNDAMAEGMSPIEVLLEKSKLPTDKEAWEAIAAELEDQQEIDSYTVTDDGIIIVIE